MDIQPKGFCPKCYSMEPYHMAFEDRTFSHNGISVPYTHTLAICCECGGAVQAAPVNDRNWYARHKAYYDQLDKICGLEPPKKKGRKR